MKVLTAPGEKYAISNNLREMLALLEDGRLYVAKTYAFDPHVRGFIERLKHNKVQLTVLHTDLKVIGEFYSTKDSEVAEHTDMQRAAYILADKAVESRASDIHIRVSSRGNTQIFFRIHNDLQFVTEYSYEYGKQLCTTIYQAMADVSDATFNELSRQDARIAEKSKIPDKLDGIRIATSPQVDGFLMVLRLLYNDTTDDFNLNVLGFAQDQINAIGYMKKRPTGIIVIGGPTGSGKSTTLQRILGSIIQESEGRKHILTVEDPPEYPIPGTVQTAVTNADTEEDRSKEYQKAIKAALRLDPDILMVSEVRDSATAKLVVQAAMTGHPCWTTVHANSGLAIIYRLLDLGVAIELLSDPTVIAGLICQRLVQKLCPDCKKPLHEHSKEFRESDIRRFMSVFTNFRDVCVKGNGCTTCNHTGIVGRTVVAETIVTDNKLMQFIKVGDRIGALDYIKNQQSVKSMLEQAIDKIGAGEVDPFLAEDIVGSLTAAEIERDHSVTATELKNSGSGVV
jgi:type II secretory ATPase GspE/PulE/Tfp pilus assembly ATPase PilB-like protein